MHIKRITREETNIMHHMNATFTHALTFKLGGIAADITSATITSELKASQDPDATALLTFDIVKTDPVNGIFTWSISDATLATLDLDIGYYDILIILGGKRYVPLYGKIKFIKGVQ